MAILTVLLSSAISKSNLSDTAVSACIYGHGAKYFGCFTLQKFNRKDVKCMNLQLFDIDSPGPKQKVVVHGGGSASQ